MEQQTPLAVGGPSPGATEANANAPRSRGLFVVIAIVLFAVIVAGLLWLFGFSSASPHGLGWFLFSFVAGLSMIVLPCTLPLAFVIVPLSLGKGYAKGLSVAILFGLGVAITLSLYGILAAVLGRAIFTFAGGGGELTKNVFYALAGVFALAAALGELGFWRFRAPSYMGAAPRFISTRRDLVKAFLLGLFLGNIGVGCPHPATPIILGQIGVVGDVFYGWLLFFVHALGRILPLLLLALLGILGVNATAGLMRHKEAIARVTAWGMVFVGGFLFVLGFFGHAWWVNSGSHSLTEFLTQEARFTGLLSERLQVEAPHAHGIETGAGFFGVPFWIGNWVLVFLWIVPLWWYWLRERRRVLAVAEPERASARRLVRCKGWFVLTLTLLLGTLFIRVIPHWFLAHKAVEIAQGAMEEGPPIAVTLTAAPALPQAGDTAALTFDFRDAAGRPLEGLSIEHERVLHAIIISEDFNTFAHIHPEDFSPVEDLPSSSAVFRVSYAFPQPGRYLVAVSYRHEGHAGSKQFQVEVGDTASRTTPVLVKDLSKVQLRDGYAVSLATDPEALRAGNPATLRYTVARDGVPVTNLEPYLGALMHLAVVSLDLSSFQHTHGEVHDPLTGEERSLRSSGDVFGPEVEAHVTFPYPGLYQVFGEFQHEGRVVVVRFLLEVGVGEPSPAADRREPEATVHGVETGRLPHYLAHVEDADSAAGAPEQMSDADDHDHPAEDVVEEPGLLGNKFLYLAISLVLIVLLTWGVSRFVRVRAS